MAKAVDVEIILNRTFSYWKHIDKTRFAAKSIFIEHFERRSEWKEFTTERLHQSSRCIMKSLIKKRIILIADNCFIREGITAVLSRHKDFEVVLRCKSNDAEYQLSNLSAPPDVVLFHVLMEKEITFKLMLHLKNKLPSTKIILMDCLPDRVSISEFIRAGVQGFIPSNAQIKDYITTIASVINDQQVLPPHLTNLLFQEIRETANHNGNKLTEESIRLTFRENTVVELVAKGLSNKEIADRLNIAHPTVKNHVHNILEKLDFSTRFQIALFTMNRASNN